MMSQYDRKSGRVSGAAAGVYKAVESVVMGGYQRLEDILVDAFLGKAAGPVPREWASRQDR